MNAYRAQLARTYETDAAGRMYLRPEVSAQAERVVEKLCAMPVFVEDAMACADDAKRDAVNRLITLAAISGSELDWKRARAAIHAIAEAKVRADLERDEYDVLGLEHQWDSWAAEDATKAVVL